MSDAGFSNFLPGLLDGTIEPHWDRHAWLMVTAWFVLVPVALLSMRYFRPAPTPFGIPHEAGNLDRRRIWATIHWVLLYAAIAMSLAGATIAVIVSKGFTGSIHAFCGLATVTMGALQIVSAWMRGTHGGKYGADSDPDRPETWHGDHYDWTPRRRWFESYHRTCGYVALAFALATVLTGLSRHWLPLVACVVAGSVVVFVALVVLFERLDMKEDIYRSVYGTDPGHPYNRARAGR